MLNRRYSCLIVIDPVVIPVPLIFAQTDIVRGQGRTKCNGGSLDSGIRATGIGRWRIVTGYRIKT